MQNFLVGMQLTLGIIIILSILMQPSKADALSGFIAGKGETFFAKNKNKTKEALLIKTTIISSILFAATTVAFNII